MANAFVTWRILAEVSCITQLILGDWFVSLVKHIARLIALQSEGGWLSSKNV